MELIVPPWAFVALRVLKLLAVCVFASGVFGAALATTRSERERFALRLMGPGWAATWTLGFTLAFAHRVSLLSDYILGSMVLSLVSLVATLSLAGREGRDSLLARGIAVTSLVLAIAWMVARPGE